VWPRATREWHGGEMDRLANFDISSRFSKPQSRLIAQLVFGAGCAVLMIAIRSLVDIVAPTAGPFALVYPTVLPATLYGHWQAGVVAGLGSFFWAWWYVLPGRGLLEFELPTDPSRVALNLVTVLIVLIFAESFRRAVERSAQARDREVEHGRLLLAELEHRTKNDFALVASLLEIQRRRESGHAERALDEALGRVRSFADVYRNIPIPQTDGDSINMRPYLSQLLERVTAAAFDEQVKVASSLADITLPRETAAAVGLYLNEALTNCAKYAFPEQRAGQVCVTFHQRGSGWELSVIDDGVGRSPAVPQKKGIGTSLMDAFARQAGASHSVDYPGQGCSVRLLGGAHATA
jgi:two-component system, sensor histidine kinase PdtaS